MSPWRKFDCRATLGARLMLPTCSTLGASRVLAVSELASQPTRHLIERLPQPMKPPRETDVKRNRSFTLVISSEKPCDDDYEFPDGFGHLIVTSDKDRYEAYQLLDGFCSLPAEVILLGRTADSHQLLAEHVHKLARLFDSPRPKLSTYLNSFAPPYRSTPRHLRTRVLLTLYSMILVQNGIRSDMLRELRLLSKITIFYSSEASLFAQERDALLRLVDFLALITPGEREERRQALATLHDNASFNSTRWDNQRYLVAVDEPYLQFCSGPSDAIQAAIRLTHQNRLNGVLQKFLQSHRNLIFEIEDLKKQKKYAEAADLCGRYIDGCIALSKDVGPTGDFQICYKYNEMTIALSKLGNWQGVYERLAQLFALPRGFWSRCSPTDRQVLKKRFERAKQNITSRSPRIESTVSGRERLHPILGPRETYLDRQITKHDAILQLHPLPGRQRRRGPSFLVPRAFGDPLESSFHTASISWISP